MQASTIKTGGQLIVHVPIGTPAHRSADQRSPVTLNEAVIDIHAPRTRQGGLEITALLAFLLVVAFWILLLASAGEAALLLLALSAVLALVALSRITARQKQGAGFAIFALVNAIFFGILMLLYAGGDL